MIYKRAAELAKFLASPPPQTRVVLFHGRDRSGVRERLHIVARALGAELDDPFNAVQLDEHAIERDAGLVADALSTLSLLGGVRSVTVQLSGERAGAERVLADALRAHLNGDYNPDALLLIGSGALSGSSPLRKAAEAGGGSAATAPIYDDADNDANKLIRDTLSADEIRLSSDALALFSARLPKDRGVARSEIERLALYVGPGSRTTVDVEALRPFLGGEAEASLAAAAEHAFGGRLAPALDDLRRAFAEGEAASAAVRVAGVHVQRLRRIGVQTRTGATLAAALKSSGVFWNNEAEISRQVRSWTETDLLAVQARIIEADIACKTTGSPDLLLTERLYMTVAAQAKRAGL